MLVCDLLDLDKNTVGEVLEYTTIKLSDYVESLEDVEECNILIRVACYEPKSVEKLLDVVRGVKRTLYTTYLECSGKGIKCKFVVFLMVSRDFNQHTYETVLDVIGPKIDEVVFMLPNEVKQKTKVIYNDNIKFIQPIPWDID